MSDKESLFDKLKSIFKNLTLSDETLEQNKFLVSKLPDDLTTEKINAEINKILVNESGWNRIKKLFEYEYEII